MKSYGFKALNYMSIPTRIGTLNAIWLDNYVVLKYIWVNYTSSWIK